jgi:hypothetical protein
MFSAARFKNSNASSRVVFNTGRENSSIVILKFFNKRQRSSRQVRVASKQMLPK